jgi:hypothetical protein
VGLRADLNAAEYRRICVRIETILSGRLTHSLLVILTYVRDSSVGIATAYGLNDSGVGVRAPVGSRIFSSPNRSDRLSYPMGTEGSFPG